MDIVLDNLRQAEGIIDDITPLKNLLESKFNLTKQIEGCNPYLFPLNKVMRICLLVGLNITEKRNVEDIEQESLSKNSQRLVPTFFTASEAEAFGGSGFDAHLAERATHARRQLLLHGRDMRIDFWAFGTDSDVTVA